MTIALTRVDENFVSRSEDDCTICGEETVEDPIFSYIACPSLCQRTDMIAEICRYIDGSIRTQSQSIANTQTMPQIDCCEASASDSNLIKACDTSEDRCTTTFVERVKGDLIFTPFQECVRELTTITYSETFGERSIISEIKGGVLASQDMCC